MEAEELIGLELENQCATCKHYSVEGVKCAAFPIAIPTVIFIDEFDHKGPYPDDNGIQYEKATGTQNRFELNIGHRIEDLTDKIDSLRLHKPGGKGHNQKLHGNRAKVGSFMDVAGQTEEELAAFTQFTPGFVEGPAKSQQKNIEDNWTSRPYDSIQAMRQRYGEGKPNFEDRQLVNDIKTTSTFNGPVYRGMSFDNKDNRTAFEGIKKDYAVGKEVDMKGINSFTSSRREAYSFADLTRTGGKIRDEETGSFTWKPTPSTDSVVIRVNSRSMRDIRNYSTYNEKEVVSLPGTRLRVTGTRTINATDAETKSGRQNVVAGRNVTKKSQVLVVEMEEIG